MLVQCYPFLLPLSLDLQNRHFGVRGIFECSSRGPPLCEGVLFQDHHTSRVAAVL